MPTAPSVSAAANSTTQNTHMAHIEELSESCGVPWRLMQNIVRLTMKCDDNLSAGTVFTSMLDRKISRSIEAISNRCLARYEGSRQGSRGSRRANVRWMVMQEFQDDVRSTAEEIADYCFKHQVQI